MKKTKKEIFTLANQLTFFRILLVPIFIFFMLYKKVNFAFYVFILAGVTDGLDGLVARMWKQKTPLGTLLDPMADKLLLVSSFLILSFPSVSYPNTIPIWLTIFVVGRDVLIGSSALFIYLTRGIKTFNPTILGKVSTIFQILTVLLVLLFNYLLQKSIYLQGLFLITLFFTITSGLHYLYVAIQLIKMKTTNLGRD
ncbi:CDP-alcohol phosphatidyltransferase family protein [SCandidatus Aminicenantes bacterium Aminicenantia_JdfR_composite]|jgi:cardiolipin synthase|nr:CDP-alcohol phosphatidyltransferase family protein [SCandidatus Aminicenantes bacterium Aminicenantia_JdfR_composite]MCP2606525.1 CDP-alcohol phosphatidyltransferase family protein [Candidatus Aminicenantes bacterium AC-708-I09]